jgi:hypothetical protein
MNILAQILPGVRDFRTPISVGALWLLTGIVAVGLLPSDSSKTFRGIWADMIVSAETFPSVALGSLALLGIYLFGIATTIIGQGLMRLIQRLRFTIIAVVLAFAVILFGILAWQFALIVVGFLALLFLGGLWLVWAYQWRGVESLGHFFARFAAVSIDLIPRLISDSADNLAMVFSPTREQLDYFMRRQVDASPRLVEELGQRMTLGTLEDVLAAAQVPLADVIEELGDGYGDIESFAELRVYLEAHPELEYAAVSKLRETVGRTLASADVFTRRRFVALAANFRSRRAAVARQLEELLVRLKVEQPALYDEYDRLKAEGEFRSAMALPTAVLVALAGVALIEHVDWLQNFWGGLTVIVFSIAVCLIFISAGQNRITSSNGLLYGALRQSVIKLNDLSTIDLDYLDYREPSGWLSEFRRPQEGSGSSERTDLFDPPRDAGLG